VKRDGSQQQFHYFQQVRRPSNWGNPDHRRDHLRPSRRAGGCNLQTGRMCSGPRLTEWKSGPKRARRPIGRPTHQERRSSSRGQYKPSSSRTHEAVRADSRSSRRRRKATPPKRSCRCPAKRIFPGGGAHVSTATDGRRGERSPFTDRAPPRTSAASPRAVRGSGAQRITNRREALGFPDGARPDLRRGRGMRTQSWWVGTADEEASTKALKGPGYRVLPDGWVASEGLRKSGIPCKRQGRSYFSLRTPRVSCRAKSRTLLEVSRDDHSRKS